MVIAKVEGMPAAVQMPWYGASFALSVAAVAQNHVGSDMTGSNVVYRCSWLFEATGVESSLVVTGVGDCRCRC